MGWTWLPGYRSIKYTHSQNHPLLLPTREGEERTFLDICKDAVPPCWLNPFLWNGHLHTMWTAVKNQGPAIHYKRRVMAAEDPHFKGHYTVDYVVAPPPKKPVEADDGGPDDAGLREDPTGIGHHRLPPRTTYFTDKEFENIGSDDTKPMLICLHGLSGGSYENYLRQVLEPLVEPTEEGAKAGGLSGANWEALVVNSRGCAGSKITTSVLYNARATWDMREVVKWARKTWPNRRLFAIGFSLGANILTNYLGEEGNDCELTAAAVVCNPWKLEVTSLALQSTWLGHELYLKVMGDHMRHLYEQHEEVIVQNKALDSDKVKALKYLYEFDREVQCATWGYPTVGAYYRDASCADSALSIRVPTFCLHAVDDPIALDMAVPYEEIEANPYMLMCATSSGGHLAWFQWGGNTRWHAKPVSAVWMSSGLFRNVTDDPQLANYFNAMAFDVNFDKFLKPIIPRKGPIGGHKTRFDFDPMMRKYYPIDSTK